MREQKNDSTTASLTVEVEAVPVHLLGLSLMASRRQIKSVGGTPTPQPPRRQRYFLRTGRPRFR